MVADERLLLRDRALTFGSLNFSTATASDIRELSEAYAKSCFAIIHADHSQKEIERLLAPYLSLLQRHRDLDQNLVSRLQEPRWWEKRIHQRKNRAIGAVSREIGLVNRESSYIDNWNVRRFVHQEERMREFREKTYVVNEMGDRVRLSDFYESSVSNPRNRRIELMARINGVEAWARSQGDFGIFVTLTVPSRMHRLSGSNLNAKFDGTDPRSAQDYLCQLWARCRSFLGRQKISVYGLRVAEPHEDGTPHWHMCLYAKPQHIPLLKRTLRGYGLQVDGNERGAKQHRVQFMDYDAAKGSFSAYLAKYVSKNVDGYNLDHDEIGNPITESVTRTTAWARTHGIRQFQFFGEPPISVWRELRKIDTPLRSKPLLEELRLAARDGDYFRYIQLMGGMGTGIIRPVSRLPNNIDEVTGEILWGSKPLFITHLLCNGVLTAVRTQQWRIETPTPTTITQFDLTREGWVECAEAAAEDLGLLSITVRPSKADESIDRLKERPPP